MRDLCLDEILDQYQTKKVSLAQENASNSHMFTSFTTAYGETQHAGASVSMFSDEINALKMNKMTKPSTTSYPSSSMQIKDNGSVLSYKLNAIDSDPGLMPPSTIQNRSPFVIQTRRYNTQELSGVNCLQWYTKSVETTLMVVTEADPVFQAYIQFLKATKEYFKKREIQPKFFQEQSFNSHF